MAWGILIAAGGLEVFWATFMKLSEGFTKPLYTVLTFAGMAASFLNKLAAADPERYGETAAMLDAKAKRVLQRQREQRQHEKNLARGKQKPWCAPPKSGQGKHG